MQALLKCVVGLGEDVFPLAALERGLVTIVNSLASFCIDAPQAPKLVSPSSELYLATKCVNLGWRLSDAHMQP